MVSGLLTPLLTPTISGTFLGAPKPHFFRSDLKLDAFRASPDNRGIYAIFEEEIHKKRVVATGKSRSSKVVNGRI
jgi:hypothetical protein